MPRLTKPIIGWCFYDFANSAFATTILAVIFNRYFAEVVAGGASGTPVHIFGHSYQIPGAAMWSFVAAMSTAVVALTAPILGAIADRAGWRKRMLFVFWCLGVAATIALADIGRGDVAFGALIFTFANIGFAGGNVFYNAFLLDITESDNYGRVSGMAWGFGYLGGGLCLALNLVMLQYPGLLGCQPGAFGVASCVVVAGLWWGIFALPTMLWIREKPADRPSISLPALIHGGWERLAQTFRQIRRYRQLMRFLLAFLLFNDGIETVIIVASIFGAEVVGLGAGELVLFFLIIQATAMVGSIIFGYLADAIGNKRTLLGTLLVWLAVVAWSYRLGWLFDLRRDYYCVGILAGIVLGGSQSVARSMQALFTPSDRSGEFFGFFAVSGKFAAIFGPLIYGGAIMVAGGVQAAILVLGVFFLGGGLLLLFVNEEEGIAAARNQAVTRQG